MTVGGMGFIPERLLMMMMMMIIVIINRFVRPTPSLLCCLFACRGRRYVLRDKPSTIIITLLQYYSYFLISTGVQELVNYFRVSIPLLFLYRDIPPPQKKLSPQARSLVLV